MVEQSFPFSGTTPGDAGPYTAEFFAFMVRALLGQDLTADASIIRQSGDGINPPLQIIETVPASAAVTTRAGSAFIEIR